MDWGWIAAGALTVLGLAVGLSRIGLQAWIQTLVESRVKARFEKELEGFRSEVRLKEAEITALQTNVLSGRAGRQAILDKRRIEAIEKLWASVIKLNQFQYPATMMTLLKLDVIGDRAQTDPKLRHFLETLSGEDLTEKLKDVALDEAERLYIPDEVWKLFSAYKGLLVYCYIRMKSASFGIGTKFFKDDKVVEEIKSVMPNFAEYLDKWGVSGAAQLAVPLRDLIFKSLQAALTSSDADVANVIATREMVKLVSEYDQKLTQESA